MAKKPKFNNPHGVPNDTADEIRALDNEKLVERCSLEYNDWMAFERIKKNDPKTASLKEEIKGLKSEIDSDEELVKMKAAYDRRKEELISEEQARLQSELKNELEPLQEDVKFSRSRFRVAMDEISHRNKLGVFKK